MAFDGFVTKAVVTELKQVLIGAKVNKVFEPNRNEVILGLYNNGTNFALDICSNPETSRICLTTHSKTNPKTAYNFCMLLRKYLIGGKIVKISSYDLERTIEIDFECYNELNDLVIRKVFVEVMSSQSNLILTNQKDTIIDSLKHFDNNPRELLPAHQYRFIEITKTSFIDSSLDSFTNTILDYVDSSLTKSILSNYIGFSKPIIQDALNKFQIDDESYNKEDLKLLYGHFKNLIANMGTNNIAGKVISEKDYVIDSIESESILPVNFFLDDFYHKKEEALDFKQAKNELLKLVSTQLKKISKKLENINAKLKECDEIDTYKLYGELLTANLYQINSSQNLSEIELENYYDDYKKITIPLDKKVSVQKNVEKFFKKYNKLKNTLAIVSKQKIETETELDYIESVIYSLDSCKSISDIEEIHNEISETLSLKKKVQEPNKKTVKNQKFDMQFDIRTINGYQVYVGKNNVQNEYISLKLAQKTDIWFHVQTLHGSHVLLRNPNGDNISDDTLFECAKIAKENSKAALDTNVSVDYCTANLVKKKPGGKPGMVIYTDFKTIIVK